MAIVQRADGKYQVQVRTHKDHLGRWKRQAATCDTLAEAEEAEIILKARAKDWQARHVAPADTPLSEYLETWLQQKADEGRKPSTLHHYRRLVEKLIVPALGKYRLRDLSALRVQRWQSDLAPRKDSPGASQAAYAHRVLRSALSDAVRLGQMLTNPAKDARPALRTPNKRPGMTLQQVDELLRSTEPRWRPLFRFLFCTGLRPSEALALRWTDVSQAAVTVSVTKARTPVGGRMVEGAPKTAAGTRTFSVPIQAFEALQIQADAQAEDHGAAGADWRDENWVFATHQGGPLDLNNVDRAFRRARNRAGLPAELTLYSLRHAAASVLAANAEGTVGAKTLGQSQTAVFTDTYAGLLPEASREAARRVEEFLRRVESHEAATPAIEEQDAR